MDIDWQGTGSMLQGWATLLGAGAVVYAARAGKRGLADWREQRQEERRVEIAEKVMTLAYRLREDMASARGRLFTGGERARAESQLETGLTDWEHYDQDRRSRAIMGQSVLNRLRYEGNAWDMIWELKPIALATFDEPVAALLQVFWAQYASVSVSAEAFIGDYPGDREFEKTLRRELFGGGDDDSVKKAIDETIVKLEQILLPILRPSAALNDIAT